MPARSSTSPVRPRSRPPRSSSTSAPAAEGRIPTLLIDLAPLRVSAPFRRLWLGLGISNIGTQLTVVAVGLQVYAITRSTLSVGVLGLCALVPLVALGLYGGAVVDAFDRRRVALIASLGLWLVTLALITQAALQLNSVIVLYALVALQSAGFAINNPARTAVVPRLLDRSLLPAANVLMTVAWNVALTGGPLLGAILVARFSFAWAYAVDAVLFTAALWALWRLPDLPPIVDAGGERPRAGWRSVVEGLRFLGTRPNVRMTFVVDLIAMIFAMPRVLLPAVGVIYLGGGATTTGILTAAFAAGAIVASLLSGGLVRVRAQGRVIVLAITAFGLSVVAFGVVLLVVGRSSPSGVMIAATVLAALCLAASGASDAISAVFRQTILQAAAPDHLRGRLQGIFIVVVAGGPRLGDLVVGGTSEWLTEAGAAVAGGLVCIALLWVIAATQRSFLHYDAEHPVP